MRLTLNFYFTHLFNFIFTKKTHDSRLIAERSVFDVWWTRVYGARSCQKKRISDFRARWIFIRMRNAHISCQWIVSFRFIQLNITLMEATTFGAIVLNALCMYQSVRSIKCVLIWFRKHWLICCDQIILIIAKLQPKTMMNAQERINNADCYFNSIDFHRVMYAHSLFYSARSQKHMLVGCTQHHECDQFRLLLNIALSILF